MTVWVYDDAKREVVTREELAKRRAARQPAKQTSSIFAGKAVQRGCWIYDRRSGELVPKTNYVPADAPQVMRDLEPYKSMHTGEMIDGRKQHRDHLRAHGLRELGNEMETAMKRRTVEPREKLDDTMRRAVQAWEGGYKPRVMTHKEFQS